MKTLPELAVIVPTMNAGPGFDDWIEAFRTQTVAPHMALVIDSSSSDETVSKASRAGFRVHGISRAEFNHGGTRRLAADMCRPASILVYLTQDAILAVPQALEALVSRFSDSKLGAVYGRQLPRRQAGLIEAHARQFNYPPDYVSTSDTNAASGIKKVFFSNSFAAYRRMALESVGGFPDDVILGEDQWVAAKMLLADWKVEYCPAAQVIHSHAYSLTDEFRRYFDIGVFHSRERWISDRFGGSLGEGSRFVASEMTMLAKSAPWLIPAAFLRDALKWTGYRLGGMESYLPRALKARLSMHSNFWNQRSTSVPVEGKPGLEFEDEYFDSDIDKVSASRRKSSE